MYVILSTSVISVIVDSQVDVLYGGTEIFDHEVSETIYHDTLLSIPTFLAICVLLLVFTSFSAWLTLCGLLSIIYSFCCAYFCYHVFFRIEALGLLNVVSVFVIIGIGETSLKHSYFTQRWRALPPNFGRYVLWQSENGGLRSELKRENAGLVRREILKMMVCGTANKCKICLAAKNGDDPERNVFAIC